MVFAQTIVLTTIVRPIRNNLAFVSSDNCKAIPSAIKAVVGAENADMALIWLEAFGTEGASVIRRSRRPGAGRGNPALSLSLPGCQR